MFRCILVILVSIVAFLQPKAGTTEPADDFPFVSTALPPNVPSESVQVSYNLVGPFGGRGGYAGEAVWCEFLSDSCNG